MANTAFNHDPALTVAASNTTAGAAVKWVASKNLGESLIILDSGGNGRIGLAGDLDLITLTSGTVTVAGTVAATTLTGAGSGITALAAGNIASGTIATARLGSGTANNSVFLRGDNTWAAAAPTFTGVEVSIGAEWGLGRDSSTAATWTQAIHDIVEGSAGTTQWNSSSNQTRIVCKSAGRYYIYGNVALAASNNNGSIEIKIKRNGNNIMTQNENGNSESSRHYFGVSRVYNLAVDDYLELFVYQDTSSNRAVQYLVENSIIIAPIFGMYKIA